MQERKMDCNISNCVYFIECKKEKCNMKYVGETKRILKLRLGDHRGYVDNLDESQDLSIIILEKVRFSDDLYRKEREKYFIRKLNTYYKGLNRQP